MRNVQPKMGVARRVRGASIALAGLATAIMLASCGGGHDDGGPPPVTPPPVSNMPPASASADVAGFIAYLKILVVTMPDADQPLDLSAFTAPTSDTALPDPGV